MKYICPINISKMQFRKVSAPIIFIGDGSIINNKVIIIDILGKILSIESIEAHDHSSIQFFPHAICPGFVNTHCHLELSHMKNLVDTGTTLLPFIDSVVKYRDFDKEVIIEAINVGDEEMFRNGIVACGDISNKKDTVACKNISKIKYYTFVEMFDLMNPDFTKKTIEQYAEVYDAHQSNDKNKKSFVPHAPYSVTPNLFDFIYKNNKSNSTVSIHNQETLAESEMFISKTGGFIDFFKGFGNTLDHFHTSGKSSINYAIENMDPNQKTIFVHNTLTTADDILTAMQWNKNIFWATCPNANLYIENRLPDYKTFMEQNQQMTIGTDSLTSNWQLSVWEEIKTIAKYCSYVPFENLITWATKNGAKALNFDETLGAIEVGKKPGLVSIPVQQINGKLRILDGDIKRIDIIS